MKRLHLSKAQTYIYIYIRKYSARSSLSFFALPHRRRCPSPSFVSFVFVLMLMEPDGYYIGPSLGDDDDGSDEQHDVIDLSLLLLQGLD